MVQEFVDFKNLEEKIYNGKNTKIKIDFPKITPEKIKNILLKYEFSEERIDNQLKKLEDLKKQAYQKTLF
ncbi:MAG: hypothetical protein AABX77_03085 [Nanoarchaeota archaeon]